MLVTPEMLGTSHNVVMARKRFTAVCALCSCKVNFQPPTMSLGSSINLAIGPESSVQLTTTFLDDRLRLGRGSRGSRFVFVRGGYADEAGAHMCTPYASLSSSCRLCFEHIPTRCHCACRHGPDRAAEDNRCRLGDAGARPGTAADRDLEAGAWQFDCL